MAATATAPVEIGTRGTIGSLLSREIEYFKGFELNKGSRRVKFGSDESGSTKKKKSKSSRRYIPTICSAMDAVDIRKEGMLGYKNLKTEAKQIKA